MKGIGAENLVVSIDENVLVKKLDFFAGSGQIWAILGANGAGKTTLMHTLAGLRKPTGGRVNLDGKDIVVLSRRDIARRLGVLLQHTVDALPSTVLETALLGTHSQIGWLKGEGPNEIALAVAKLKLVGIEHLSHRRVDTLSGGERRRLALATVLVQSAHVLLLDEPTNHLDLKHQFELLEIVQNTAQQKQTTVMMILHDVNLAARFCSHVMLLYGGGEVSCGTARQLLNRENLSRLYGRPIIDTEIDGRAVFIAS